MSYVLDLQPTSAASIEYKVGFRGSIEALGENGLHSAAKPVIAASDARAADVGTIAGDWPPNGVCIAAMRARYPNYFRVGVYHRGPLQRRLVPSFHAAMAGACPIVMVRVTVRPLPTIGGDVAISGIGGPRRTMDGGAVARQIVSVARPRIAGTCRRHRE